MGPDITPFYCRHSHQIGDPGCPVLNLCCPSCRLWQGCHSRSGDDAPACGGGLLAVGWLSVACSESSYHLLSVPLALAWAVGAGGHSCQVLRPRWKQAVDISWEVCRPGSGAGVLPEASRAFLSSRHRLMLSQAQGTLSGQQDARPHSPRSPPHWSGRTKPFLCLTVS